VLPPIETSIDQVIRDLKTPAGDSVEFSSLESIQANRASFVERCHSTWKRLHNESIERLFFFEGFLLREKTNPMGSAAKEYANYNQALIRKINDSIVWSVFGMQRHVIKRFCLYKARPALLESNPGDVYAALRTFNALPMSLAIWNDATSCVDIGDVTYVEDGTQPNPEFIELKSGEVNAEIAELLSLQGEEHSLKFEEFKRKRGQAGVKQHERVLRQQKTGEQALDLLANDQGIDPVTGQEMRVVDISTKQDSYDAALGQVLTNVLDGRLETCELIAGCIWIYANSDPSINREQAAVRFINTLSNRISQEHLRNIRRPGPHDRDRIVPLIWGLHQPVSLPLFLRSLSAEIIAAALCGELRHKVMMYIDWSRFAVLCKEAGASISFLGGKAVRRSRAEPANMRLPIIGGRLAQLAIEDVKAGITDPMLIRILFDGITPQTVINDIIAHAQIMLRSVTPGGV